MPREPVVPKHAATVLLVRDDPEPPPGRTPLQVFLQRRVAGMAFAGGMTVFPGGGVDPTDRTGVAAWVGPSPAEWGTRLGHPAELAGALVTAAVRETYEECGVLLAGHGRVVLAEDARADLVARRRTLPELLGERPLRADLLRAWSRWITPEPSPKRYDVAFLVAQVPEGQVADAHTTEAVEARWWHPSEALERWHDGEIELMMPTSTTLQEIDEHPDCAAVIAAAPRREIRPVLPRMRRDGDAVVVTLPDACGSRP